MAETPDSQDLETRLERLSLETDTATLAQFQSMAAALRDDDGFQAALRQVQALANENRLITLALLRERDSLCACEIQAALDCSNATVSHHMTQLVGADLVAAEQRGKWKHYDLTPEGERLLAEVLP
jgi:ArsR family transcriptional regulator